MLAHSIAPSVAVGDYGAYLDYWGRWQLRLTAVFSALLALPHLLCPETLRLWMRFCLTSRELLREFEAGGAGVSPGHGARAPT